MFCRWACNSGNRARIDQVIWLQGRSARTHVHEVVNSCLRKLWFAFIKRGDEGLQHTEDGGRRFAPDVSYPGDSEVLELHGRVEQGLIVGTAIHCAGKPWGRETGEA